MVVLSAAVVTKSGRPIVARQFVEMSRLRIEGLLAAFPKLMGSGPKQHTFIETESVRYVWQPVEQVFLILITNKASNIVEDLDTLRLLSKLVPEVAGGHSEEKLSEKCFELIFAFDEVITTGGYREYIDIRQIRTNLEMDSHEEKLHNMVKKTKIDSARDQATHMSKVIRTRQKEAAKSGGLVAPGTMAGMGGGGETDNDSLPEREDIHNAGYNNGGISSSSYTQEPIQQQVAVTPSVPLKSLKLNKKGAGKGSTLLDKVAKEENLNLNASLMSSKKAHAQASAAAEQAAQVSIQQPMTILIDEKLSVQLSQEGVLESFDLKGTLTVTANEELAAKTKVLISPAADHSLPSGLNFQVHPKVLKSEWESSNLLSLKDKEKGFPIGRPVGVLRWSLSSNDESIVPLILNCWPEDEGGGTINVNIEYTLQKLQLELHKVEFHVPLGTAAQPHIISLDGSYSHSPSDQSLIWELDLIDSSNSSGTLEFTIQSDDLAAFFPISVSFTCKQLFNDLSIASVTTTDDGADNIPFSVSKALTADNYRVS
mmetsp:Transcript_13745/g.20504  ORF Transcript_13745/g.20504 Transcript_13745/m.20504 type:complete len:541 (-) Transcript_13745:515-2137(-)|eukprot:CAMPEP_0197285732 /NCGR_PEP_ID=MMETSP0890-20130614/1096_1 /TAXON_ID=44058 ORGANISM="Aureoumbra lagunensis, Strain CCMP1510" /NCGR_SAMPLE_ID=MMETSP0890 /ASSEMBLY_ACC=CAM_ASM_000533 /LENGTH=540 /DNA_ID=CAMNT_0042753529 /DNA_START=72 /DNA_END=1694 /DNA_ORIENTATION=-